MKNVSCLIELKTFVQEQKPNTTITAMLASDAEGATRVKKKLSKDRQEFINNIAASGFKQFAVPEA